MCFIHLLLHFKCEVQVNKPTAGVETGFKGAKLMMHENEISHAE